MPSVRSCRLAVCLAVASTWPTSVAAQALLATHIGTGGDAYGEALAILGDVNGDGRADYVMGDALDDGAGLNAGRVELRSGLDHALLLAVSGAAAGDEFGRQVAAMGDLDLDGVPDWAVSSPEAEPSGASSAGRVQLRSGADGSVLQSWAGTSFQRLGEQLHALDDLDGDGRRDVMFTRKQSGSNPAAVVVRSSVSGALLLELPAWGLNVGGFAYAIAPTGDLDGDGRGDLAIASEHWLGVSGDRRLRLHSSATGALIHEFVGAELPYPEPAVAILPDVDGDGVDDLAITRVEGSVDRVVVMSGATFSELWHLDEPAGWTSLGRGIGSWPDVDGDGRDDLAVQYGYGVFWNREIALLSSADGAQLGHLAADSVQYRYLGGRLVRGPDMNGDGVDDVLVGCPTPYFWGEPGALRVVSGVCNGQVLPYGAGLAGSGGFVPALAASGCPAPGTPVTLSVLDGLSAATAMLLIGLTPVSIPFKQGELLVDPGAAVLISVPLSLSAGLPGIPGGGTLDLDLLLPDDPGLSGLSLVFQVLVQDPGAAAGWAMTGGLQWVLG